MAITKKQAEKAVVTVKYFGAGYEQCRKHVLKLIKRMDVTYGVISAEELMHEVNQLKMSIIDTR